MHQSRTKYQDNRGQKSALQTRFITKNRQNNRKKSTIYRDLAHDYRFDKSRLIANFLAILRTWVDILIEKEYLEWDPNDKDVQRYLT